MLADDSWAMYLVQLGSQDCIASRAAMRALFVAGYEVEWIADACDVPMRVVQNALTSIP
jgi:hypothetical protein